MSSAPIAIIDIGTNTFNILIAKIENQQIITLYHNKIPARLGKGGIGQKKISPEAFERGINALIQHQQTAQQYQCETILAAATSMLRDASNADKFCKAAFEKTGITIRILSGTEEATTIYQGVKHAVDLSNKKLIMDIGGGSTEFIIADQQTIYWQKSYNLGITRLYEYFQHSDPITQEEHQQIRKFLQKELHELFTQTKNHQINSLVGSAGTFESYATILAIQQNKKIPEYEDRNCAIKINDFLQLAHWFYISTHEERKQVKGLIELRRDLIVLASILIEEVINGCYINEMQLSTYALKEGWLFSHIQT